MIDNCERLRNLMRPLFPCSEVVIEKEGGYCEAHHPDMFYSFCDWEPIQLNYYGSYCQEYEQPVVVWKRGGENQPVDIQEDDLH